MVERTSQVFRPHPIPARAETPGDLVSWVALQFRDLANYVTALEERIRPAVFWSTLVDQSIGVVIPFTVWPFDNIIRTDAGAGDYDVTITGLVIGTGGQTFVEVGVSDGLAGSPIIPGGEIPLKNGEELWLTSKVILPNAKGLEVWIRGENVDVTVASVLAVRIGS